MASRCVFRCFRTIERWMDKFTGAAGPVFVTFAAVALSAGVVCFFEVIQPDLRWPLVTIPLNALVACNMLVHYYLSCTVPPGFIDEPAQESGEGLIWARKRKRKVRLPNVVGNGHAHGDDEVNVTPAHISRCKRCNQLRPERAHHCRVCNRCVLKYDHHCPVRINQCVGLYNERHFVLFLIYIVIATGFFAFAGYDKFWDSMGFTYTEWKYYTPVFAFSLFYILSGVMCLAVGIMMSYHVWQVCMGETSVDSHDHRVYREVAKERGGTFENSYDLGKLKNLEIFFNVGQDGYPLYTLILPLRVLPYTDGRSWPRKPGFSRHIGVELGEELTDDDDEE
ncbi:zf-DHHC-domain-containing protein [Schizopora paradoxa]|uniref:Palmitoyltransferase n=1 Tax=Schizopora paradoxa TaxID=27342 RepID=A0A0H2SRG7_9AGAM|nr:zf-DHHC-domain-containing protein [Schizopora paradoxa]